MKGPKITVRPTLEEYEQIQKKASAANMSVNRYLIESALCSTSRNERQLSLLMGQLCVLENHIQETDEVHELKKTVNNWRHQTMKIMEGC